MTTLVAVQYLLYGAAWLLAAKLLREARRPALLWAGYGLLFGLGLAWLTRGGPPVPGLTAGVAVVFIASYALAVAGIDAFVNGRLAHGRIWLGLCGAACASVLAADGLGWPWWAWQAAYDVGTALLLGAPLCLLHRRLVAEFGVWGWMATVAPTAMGLLTAGRAVQLLSLPQPAMAPPLDTGDGIRLLASLMAGAFFNLSLLALIVGRTVMRLQQLVDTDSLTGVLSRRGIERHLRAEWQLSSRHHRPLSLAFVDVDDFKHINDTAGHAVGDRILVAVADGLRRQARGGDLVGRWGGDEFLVVMPYTEAAGARQAVQRLQRGVRTLAPPWPAGLPGPGVSVGVVTREAGDQDLEALIERADAEMYRRKHGRRRGLAA